jgi:hypothetical protein
LFKQGVVFIVALKFAIFGQSSYNFIRHNRGKEMKNLIRNRNQLLLYHCFAFIVLVFLLHSCAGWMGFPTYYDATTYKNLTDLKPDVLKLYDTFTNADLDEKRIDKIDLKLAQTYEYEKGKGLKNRETYMQINLIIEMFKTHVKDRIENGIWAVVHRNNQKENIAEAFDIAIRTENLKNKND